MKISEKLANFAGKLIGLKPASKVSREIAKAVRDPRISEPVWMMLESIRTNPKNWKVAVELPEDMSTKEQIRRSVRGITGWPVNITVRDKANGEVYNGTVLAEVTTVAGSVIGKAVGRLTSLLIIELMSYPDWMTKEEARELVYVLSKEQDKRIQKAQERKNRRTDKLLAEAAERRERSRITERARLTQVYGGSK